MYINVYLHIFYIFLKTFGNAWFSLNCLYNEMVTLQTDIETGKRENL